MAGNDIPAGTGFVWEQAERRLEAQMRQADALDTKAAALVGLHALAAGLVASAIRALHGPARWVGVGVIAGLIASGWFAFSAFRIESYSRDPSPADLWSFGVWNREQIQYRFLATRLDALRSNRERLDAKARRIAWSLGGVGLVALAAGIAAMIGLVLT